MKINNYFESHPLYTWTRHRIHGLPYCQCNVNPWLSRSDNIILI